MPGTFLEPPCSRRRMKLPGAMLRGSGPRRAGVAFVSKVGEFAKRLIAVRPCQVGGLRAMSDDRSTITIRRHAYAAMLDAVQRAVIDKGASKASRKAAFSGLLALLDAGLISDTVSSSPAANGNGPAPAQVSTGLRLMG
jgi:hypothetical protein